MADMAMEANSGVKPSLARYAFRGTVDVAGPRGGAVDVADAADKDEHILALIEHQATVAAASLRIGDGRKAITVLRRAFKMAESHTSPPLPIGRLAQSLTRLQLCAALSHLGRHDQAYNEACQARFQIDELWRTMSDALDEAAVADAEGDASRPAKPLRKMILEPPVWLPRVIEVAVQSRQAMAVELEFLGAHEKADGSSAAGSAVGDLEEVASVEHSKATSLANNEAADKLHAEACELAQQLLPSDSDVRKRVQRAFFEARARRKAQRVDRSKARRKVAKATTLAELPVHAPVAMEGRERPPPLELPELPLMQKLGDKRQLWSPEAKYSEDLPLHPSTASTACPGFGGGSGTWHTASITSIGSSTMSWEEMVPTLRTPSGRPTAPPGDVRVHSFMRSKSSVGHLRNGVDSSSRSPSPSTSCTASPYGHPASQPQSKARGGSPSSRAGTAGRAAATRALGTPPPASTKESPEPDRSVDPFTDWKRSVENVGKMSLLQLTIRTHDGQRKIQHDLSLRNRRFKTMELNDMSKEELFDARVNCSPHGIVVHRKAHKREEQLKTQSWKPTERHLRREKTSAAIWDRYGIDLSMRNPTVQDLRALYHEAISQTPEEQARKFHEQQEQERMKADRERQDRWNRQNQLRNDLNISAGTLTARKVPESVAP
mmetsp:Transcript_133026/g.331970  ORF Transcript_133026/g.331970 Transcript_133026/m.331970 type:complete len:663 (-) Transcript_133026:262-2250(-)